MRGISSVSRTGWERGDVPVRLRQHIHADVTVHMVLNDGDELKEV